ncbi:hypothetical protein CRM93_14845 [Acetobacter fabarum]|nr:hypothetical protein CRM93_14845 [Acetobacter fabarum]
MVHANWVRGTGPPRSRAWAGAAPGGGATENGGMPVTKITLSTAMRARDVSRPRDEQLAEAAEREEAAGRHAEEPAPGRAPRHQAPPDPVPRDPAPRDPAPRQRRQPAQEPGPAEPATPPRAGRRRSG